MSNRAMEFTSRTGARNPSGRLRTAGKAPRKSRTWLQGYLACLAWSDATIVILVVLVAQLIRFGADGAMAPNGASQVPAIVISTALATAWLFALRAFQTLDRRVIGSGSQEYSRVVTACLTVFGLLAIIDLLFRLNIARGFLAVALPLGTLGLLLSRWGWRQRLASKRRDAQNLEHVLVVGRLDSAVPLMCRLEVQPELGYRVVGICHPRSDTSSRARLRELREVELFGSFDDLCHAVQKSGATTVAVTSAEALGHSAMQELSWDLEGMDVDMLVAPGVTDIAGPRMMLRPVAGLPLLHIDKPRYEGANRFRKALVDRVGAAVLLIAISPVIALVATAIKVDSRGPVFYRAQRIGINNKPFEMWKFRSMVQHADQLKNDLRGMDEGAGLLFKMRDDPRVTRVGRFIRRYSIDELPQLFNVLSGTMSLVGPRPPLPDEVEHYDGRVARRMLVKPGMTGLWQVSGRSDLSWEESVRLDLSYVENWSIMQDALILWKTARAVLAKDGAY